MINVRNGVINRLAKEKRTPKGEKAMTELQNFVNGFGFGISKEKLIEKAYRQLSADGHDCYILNGRYIGIDGKEYQLIKSRKHDAWIAKEF